MRTDAGDRKAREEEIANDAYVLREMRGACVQLTLNRGARINPLSRAMIEALQRELDRVGEDESVRGVVIAAAGRGFSAGHDLQEMRSHADDEPWLRELFAACNRMMLTLIELPVPVIARVHGVAAAAGCQLVSMCDLAVAATDARFALPGLNVGLFCSTPAVAVGRNLLRKPTMEMLLTGEQIDAERALALGLVNRVVPAVALDAEIDGLMDTIAARSRAVIAAGKRVFYRQVEAPIEDAYRLAADAMTCNMGFEDATEGMEAFLGKRAARWRHR